MAALVAASTPNTGNGRGPFAKLWRTPSSKSKRGGSSNVDDEAGFTWMSGDDLDPSAAWCSSLKRKGSVPSCLSYTLEPSSRSRPTTPTLGLLNHRQSDGGVGGGGSGLSSSLSRREAERQEGGRQLGAQHHGEPRRSDSVRRDARGGGCQGERLRARRSSDGGQSCSIPQRDSHNMCTEEFPNGNGLVSHPFSAGESRQSQLEQQPGGTAITTTTLLEKKRKFNTLTLPRRSNTFAVRSTKERQQASAKLNQNTPTKEHAAKGGSTLLRRFSFRMKSSLRKTTTTTTTTTSGGAGPGRRLSSDADEVRGELDGIDVEYEVKPPTRRHQGREFGRTPATNGDAVNAVVGPSEASAQSAASKSSTTAMGAVQSYDVVAERKRHNLAWKCTVSASDTSASGNMHDSSYCEDDDATIGYYTQIELTGDIAAEIRGHALTRSNTIPARLMRSACKLTGPDGEPRSRSDPDRPNVVNLRESPRKVGSRPGSRDPLQQLCTPEEPYYERALEPKTALHRQRSHSLSYAHAGCGGGGGGAGTRQTPDSGVSLGENGAAVAPPPRLAPRAGRRRSSQHACHQNLPGGSAEKRKTSSSDSGCDSGEDSALLSAEATPTSGLAPPSGQASRKASLQPTASTVSDVVYSKWFRSHRVSMKSTAGQQQAAAAVGQPAPFPLMADDIAVVVEPFAAQLPDEISVRADDVVTVLRNQKTWLWVQDWRGEQGFVPTAACRLMERERTQTPLSTREPDRHAAGQRLAASDCSSPGPCTQSGSEMDTPKQAESNTSTLHRNDSLRAAVDSSASSRQALMPEYLEWCKARKLRAQMRRSLSASETSAATSPITVTGGAWAIPGAPPAMGEMSVVVSNQPERCLVTPTDSVSVDSAEVQERAARQNAIERNRQLSELRRLLSLTARRDETNEEKELLPEPPLGLLLSASCTASNSAPVSCSHSRNNNNSTNISNTNTGNATVISGTATSTTAQSTAALESTAAEEPHRLSVANLRLHTKLATRKADAGSMNRTDTSLMATDPCQAGNSARSSQTLPHQPHHRHHQQQQQNAYQQISRPAPVGAADGDLDAGHYGKRSLSDAATLPFQPRLFATGRPAGGSGQCRSKGAASPFYARRPSPSPLVLQQQYGRQFEFPARTSRDSKDEPRHAELDYPSTKHLQVHMQQQQNYDVMPCGATKAHSDDQLAESSLSDDVVISAAKSHSDSSVMPAPHFAVAASCHMQQQQQQRPRKSANSHDQNAVRLVCLETHVGSADWQISCQRSQWLYTQRESPAVGENSEGPTATAAAAAATANAPDDVKGLSLDKRNPTKVTVAELTGGQKWIWVRDPYTNMQGLVPSRCVKVA